MNDFIILGSGMSGIYTAYLLSFKYPNSKIVILEKNKFYGGRVQTFSNKHMTVNTGAGRFHNGQKHILKLINDLKLQQNIIDIPNSIGYAPSDGTDNILFSNFQAPTQSSLTSFQFPFSYHYYSITQTSLDLLFGPKTIPNAAIILDLIVASKLYSDHYLRNISFLDFSREILNKEQVQFLIDSFGYYDKLTRSNAYDTLLLIQNNQSPINTFYSLKGGLGLINDAMIKILQKNNNVSFLYDHNIENIQVIQNSLNIDTFHVFCSNFKKPIIGYNCISALPKQALEIIPYFKPLVKPFLKHLICTPMCRIFAKYKLRDDGKVWFHNIVKVTTNNNLRMVLPIDYQNGVIMISYSDTKFADYWNRLFISSGKSGVHKQIIHYIKLSFGITVEPHELVDLQLFYWDCAVAHWAVGAHSENITNKIIKPVDNLNLFICGEHFSQTGQQWMEGALETAHKVVDKIAPK